MNNRWMVALAIPLVLANTSFAADSGAAAGTSVQAGVRATESGGRPVAVLKKANAVRGSAQTVGKVVGSGGNSVGGVGRVVSGTAVVPLSVGAVVLSVGGAVSAGASQGTASGTPAVPPTAVPVGSPLEITSETITVMPPNEALQRKPDTQLEGKTSKTTP